MPRTESYQLGGAICKPGKTVSEGPDSVYAVTLRTTAECLEWMPKDLAFGHPSDRTNQRGRKVIHRATRSSGLG
jgi:hypothetical protein